MIHDLSMLLNTETLPFPDSNDPYMTWKTLVDHSIYKSQVALFSMVTHYGTHVDVPLHYIAGGQSTAEAGLDRYCGQAVCIEIENFPESGTFDLGPVLEANCELIKSGDILILRTGWEERVGRSDYFLFPDFGEDTGELMENYGLKGIGFDLPSIDRNDKAHISVLSRGMSIIESLVNLKPLTGTRFFFCAVPLKFENGDGSPVRAIAILD